MIREPGFQPRETLPIRPRVYVKRADQKPLTWEDHLGYFACIYFDNGHKSLAALVLFPM